MEFEEDPDSLPVECYVCNNLEDIAEQVKEALDGVGTPSIVLEGLWICPDCGDKVPGFNDRRLN